MSVFGKGGRRYEGVSCQAVALHYEGRENCFATLPPEVEVFILSLQPLRKFVMYAIVEIAGLQYKVQKDQRVYVNRLAGQEGESIS
ncbi:MAG: bL21 family ribosomal protein, partial [Schleiferiaceae bacterium]